MKRHIAALTACYLMLTLAFAIAPGPSLAASENPKLSTYTNKAYGFSFRYPTDCTLTEGDQVDLNWGYSGRVRDSLLHGVTVTAVELPYDPYRGTDFGLAFLKVSVDTGLTSTECNRSAFHGLEDVQTEPGKFPPAKVGENQFTEAIEQDVGMGKQTSVQYYHVFRNRACYEFQLGLGTGGYGITDSKKVDDDAVFRKLKAILATLTIRPTTIAPQPLKLR